MHSDFQECKICIGKMIITVSPEKSIRDDKTGSYIRNLQDHWIALVFDAPNQSVNKQTTLEGEGVRQRGRGDRINTLETLVTSHLLHRYP